MTITVSVSQFRQNMSNYIAKAQSGVRVVVRDEKENEDVVEIVGKSKWDAGEFTVMLDRVAGTFTAKNHPEWATKKNVEKWLRNSRSADERKF